MDELEFEKALIEQLKNKGWEENVIKNPTQEDLIQNWANILFENNRAIDRLNDYPLTKGEMNQIIEKINELKTPLKLNSFINGRTISITRDNPQDKLHFGKEISLKIYDRKEIAAGQSRYQIAEQPQFKTRSEILNQRRGDIMLLINGMPLIHIELKKEGIPVSQACNQIEKYAQEGVYKGIFALVQIFIAMEPNETLYFANPGPDGKFNPDFYFHWANYNNEPINDWREIVSSLLSIPMAHQLIGHYTIADDIEGTLKVMRSYQYYVASKISDTVAKKDWTDENQRGGYIWHTTGSGKTLTSFKAAQLISNSKDADKVVFLMDRIELGIQSLREYRGFAEDDETVQSTENTNVLVTKLKSDSPEDTLIVTSIQKMSNIKDEEDGIKEADIKKIQSKRLVFIIDECHRDTFGEMLIRIKDTFPKALFFGFTGTPIFGENMKKGNTMSDLFGDELHRYSIADGIRDKNVLGFDPYKVLTFKERDIRRKIALEKSKSKREEEALSNEKKKEVYLKYMNELNMVEIEKHIPTSQYETEEHQNKVVEDILENFIQLSVNRELHSIFATSSIKEAIQYYRLFKEKMKEKNLHLNITGLFDPNIDNKGNINFKENGLEELINDYNKMFDQHFKMSTYAKLKKDISSRLAHKKPYQNINKEEQIDILIVVDQMLTGYDSKWINTLYLDKILKYENIIQAFSRTNRLYNPKDKPFGVIKYYRKPFTMEENIKEAVKLYSGDKPLGLFVEKLDRNIEKMNIIFEDIKELFKNNGIKNFEKNPKQKEERKKFVGLFNKFSRHLRASKIQGFKWNKKNYKFENGKKVSTIFTELDYNILLARYKELEKPTNIGKDDIPYDIKGYITEINTEKIDSDYMNRKFEIYRKALNQEQINKEELNTILNALHKSFASLSQKEQKYANIFLHDVQSGSIELKEGKTFKDYIIEYQSKAKNDKIYNLVNIFGLDEKLLREFMNSFITQDNINVFGKFDNLKNTVNINKAKEYFEKRDEKVYQNFEVKMKVDEYLRKFILENRT